MNYRYRAIVHNPGNGRKLIESVWLDTEKEAEKVGKMGVKFYSGSHYTIENDGYQVG